MRGVGGWGAGVEVLERGTLVEGGKSVPKRRRHCGVGGIRNVCGGGAFGRGFNGLWLVRLFGGDESLAFFGLGERVTVGSSFDIGDGDRIRGLVTAAQSGVPTSGRIDRNFSKC